MPRVSHGFRSLLLSVLLPLALLTGGCGDVQVGKAESVATLAGAAGGGGFFDGSPAGPVRFDSPGGVAVTSTGNRFVADTENHVIRRIDASGNITTFAGKFGVSGTADGTGANASFSRITAITAVGTFLYVCDNNAIRSVSPAGAVVTLAGLPGTAGSTDNTAGNANVRFFSPGGIASNGSTILFVADTGNHKIRWVNTVTGATTTAAGSGVSGFADNTLATAARFNSPEGVTFDGAALFVADTGNHAIRKVASPFSSGEVSILAGDGVAGFVDNTSGTSVQFSSPRSLISVGTDLFVADSGNHVIREVDTANFGFTTTLAGFPGIPGSSDGTGSVARFSGIRGVGIQEGITALFLAADTGNHSIRQVTLGGVVTTVSGNPPRTGTADGSGVAARFSGPAGIALLGDDLYVADTENHTIRKITPAGGVSTFAGLAGTSGSTDSPPRFNRPRGIAALGTDLYVTDTGNHTLRKITSAGVVSTVAGLAGTSGSTDSPPRFNGPQGISALGSALYVTDTGNHTVRKVTLSGVVTTVAGSAGTPGSADGTGPSARFNAPAGIAVTGTSALYVADTGNHSIRRIAISSGATDTYAGVSGVAGFADGQGNAARFSSPDGIGAVGTVLYVADPGNHAVRRISASRTVTTFAGTPEAATTRDGDASSALLNSPAGIAGNTDTIYFTDVRENLVRKILY